MLSIVKKGVSSLLSSADDADMMSLTSHRELPEIFDDPDDDGEYFKHPLKIKYK